MIRRNILEMSRYKPPLEGRSSGDYLLLDFNERTVPVSPRITKALVDFVVGGRIHQYPEYNDFLEHLAAYVGVAERELLITNGSDHGIELVFRLVWDEGKEAIIPAPSFPIFSHCAKACGFVIREPLYSRDGGYPFEEVLGSISDKTGIIVICSPNNPTGTVTPRGQIVEILRRASHAAVLVDECYFEYSQATVKDEISHYPNLLIARTFSKTWGLAALRLGYIISNESTILELAKLRGPYDVNRLAIVAGKAALGDPTYMESYVREVMDISMPKFLNFLKEKKLRFWPPGANFVLFHPPSAETLANELRERGILVRPRSGPGIEGTIRLNVGTQDQTARLIDVMSQLV